MDNKSNRINNETIFVNRTTELDEVKSAINKHDLTVLSYENRSGITAFLKELCNQYYRLNSVVFYVDLSARESVPLQILFQIISQTEKSNREIITKVIFSVFDTLKNTLYFVPFASEITSFINDITDLFKKINKKNDKYDDFLKDYFLESEIIKIIQKFKNVKLFVDNGGKMTDTTTSHFLLNILSNSSAKILIAEENLKFGDDYRYQRLVSNTKGTHYIIPNVFKRPDGKMAKEFLKSKKLSPDILKIQEGLNIYEFMSIINYNELELNNYENSLINILFILKINIRISVLKQLIIQLDEIGLQENFDDALNSLKNKYVIKIINTTIVLNFIPTKNMILNNLANELVVNNALISVLSNDKDIQVDDIKWMINTTQNERQREKFSLDLIHMQKNKGLEINPNYLNSIIEYNHFDDLKEACIIYYNNGIYKRPLQLLEINRHFKTKKEYKLLTAVLLDRNQNVRSLGLIEKMIIENHDNIDIQCLLVINLCTSFLNFKGFRERLYKDILNSKGKYYYIKYTGSIHYYYLQRVIAYYLEDKKDAASKYIKCISYFKNHENTTEYYRTINNYLAFLLRNKLYKQAQEMIEKHPETFFLSDHRISYIFNNLGVFENLINDRIKSEYFELYNNHSSTETSLIYGKINHAMAIAKHKPDEAHALLMKQKHNVDKSSIVTTKRFYYINLLAVKYMLNIDLVDDEILYKCSLLMESDKNNMFINQYQEILSLLKRNEIYNKDYYINIYAPGFLFYRQYPLNLLFDSIST